MVLIDFWALFERKVVFLRFLVFLYALTRVFLPLRAFFYTPKRVFLPAKRDHATCGH